MPEPQEQAVEDNQKQSFSEFWNITKWSFSLIYKLKPTQAVTYFITSTVNEFTGLVNTYLLAKIVDKLITTLSMGGPGLEPLYPYLGAVLGFNVFTTITSFFRQYSMNSLRTATRPLIRQAYYTKLYNLGIQTLEQPDVNNKINRANMYVWNVEMYAERAVDAVIQLVRMFTTFFMLLGILPGLAPLVVLSLVPYYFFDRKYRGILWKHIMTNTEDRRNSDDSSHDLTSSTMLQEITVTQAFDFIDNKFIQFQLDYIKKWMQIVVRWFSNVRMLTFISDLLIFGAYIRVLLNALNRVITIGDVTFQVRIINTFQEALMRVISSTNDLMESSMQIKEVYQLFVMEPVDLDGNVSLPRLAKGPEIRFLNASFKYPNSEKLIIENFNLRIKPGEKLAIVGANGAGKTTLVKLMSRIYRLTEGELLINGENINNIILDSWYENMGVLFQDYNRYPQFTLKENIVLGNPRVAVDEVALRLAAQQADALSFIEEFPNKFDQILSEKYKGGIRPSSGQWQKIAIARFFYRNAPLVIFDEPTASIDPVSEYNIFNRIYEFFKDKTVIIISHRFSTVRNADRIIVLDKGKVIEEGNHTHLMSINGKYAEAFTLQAKGYISESSNVEQN